MASEPGRMQVCTSLQTDNHASTPLLSFLQAGCPSGRPTNSDKALKVEPKTSEIMQQAFSQMKKFCNSQVSVVTFSGGVGKWITDSFLVSQR